MFHASKSGSAAAVVALSNEYIAAADPFARKHITEWSSIAVTHFIHILICISRTGRCKNCSSTQSDKLFLRELLRDSRHLRYPASDQCVWIEPEPSAHAALGRGPWLRYIT